MRKIFFYIAIFSITSSPLLAQSSAASRAQQLQKLEEDMNSPDPNLRLATLEVAMESGSLAMKRKALDLAISSSDKTLRSIGMRYLFCENKIISLRFATQDKRSVRFSSLDSGQRSIEIKNCSPSSGNFQTFSASDDKRKNYTLNGSFSGGAVVFNFPVFSSTSVDGQCNVSLTLNKERNFQGQMACTLGNNTYGPVAAVIING